MAQENSHDVPIEFPIKGIDRSQPHRAQPDLTCAEALNVRPFTPDTGRMSGGTREGISRLFPAPVGVAGARRINSMCVAPRTVILAPSTTGSRVNVIDLMDGFGGASALINTYGVYADLRGGYVIFRKAGDGAAVPFVLGPKLGTNQDPAGEFRATIARNDFSSVGNLTLFQTGVVADGNTGVAMLYPTTNDVNLGIWADTYVGGTMVSFLSCDGMGPFVRGSLDLKQMIVAYLEFTGQLHTVRLVIDKIDGSVVTRLKTSQKEFQLRGVIAAGANIGVVSTCFIRLTGTPKTLTAKVDWPNGTVGGVFDTLQLTGADGELWATQNRAGALMRGNFQTTTGLTNFAGVRWIKKLEYTRIEPYAYPVVAECRASLLATGTSPNFWLLPTGFSASTHASGMSNTPIVTVGGAVAPGTYFGAAQNHPTGKTTPSAASAPKFFEAVASRSQSLNLRTQLLALNTVPAGSAHGLDIYYRDISTVSTDRDDLNPVFRLTADHQYMIRVEIERDISLLTFEHNQSFLTRIRVAAIHNNAGTRTRTELVEVNFNSSTPNGAPLFNIAQGLRWTHVGTTLTLLINNMVAWTYDYSTSPSWTGVVSGTTYGSLMGVDVANNSGTVDSQSEGFRVVNMSPVVTPAVAEGTDVLAFTSARIEVGSLENPGAGTSVCVGNAPVGAEIERTLLFSKIYATDGTSLVVVDPILKTVEPYTVLRGVGIDVPTLVCTYRGRLVCAAPKNNRPFWIMSRVADATDMDLGDLVSRPTKAYAGNNTDVGQPAEGIKALIPFSDDYLLFGCDSSLWVLEGDPGAGGRMQVVSYSTGIIGSRAWCFAEGRLFFMGLGGLYVMNGTRQFEQVGARRIAALDLVNPATTLVQMVYDNADQAVRIFMTPRDGSVGRHVWYYPQTDAFFEDQYPAACGPWSVDQLTGAAEIDRRILLGGDDGLLRRPDTAAYSDDGVAIATQVRTPPFELANGTVQMLARELQASGVPGSGPVDWFLMTGASCQEAASKPTSQSARAGQWFQQTDSFQQPVGLRERTAAVQLALSSLSATKRWAIERMILRVQSISRRRDNP